MNLQRQEGGRIAWLVGWALAAAILVAGAGMAALQQDFAEPDNAMRLVRVRDMLAGQGWFDSIQHRLNPPEGTPMHWAQWIDAVLAAPIMALKPFIGQQSAEVVMAFAWPFGLLGLFMFLVVRISGEIGEHSGLRSEAQWAAALIGALAFPALDKFSPGSFDHHNVEMILGLTAVWGLIRMREQPLWGVGAGAAVGLAMATAAEGVPMVAAALVVAGLLWLFRPTEFARGFARLGLGLVASSLIMLAVLVPPTDWVKPVCDAMGAPFLGFGLVGGGIAVTLAFLPPIASHTLLRRLGASVILGGLGAFALMRMFPECLGGGYAALGEEMSALWMTQISETRSLADLLKDDPGMLLAVSGAATVGLISALFFLRRHWREPAGSAVFGFLLMSWVVLAWQIRGAAFATAFAIPFGAWAVAIARREYRLHASMLRALGFVLAAASASAAAWASAGEALQSRFTDRAVLQNYESRVSSAKACATPEAFRSLTRAPKGVMLNQFGLGAGVLVWTEHGVLAGPYHRDVIGTMTMINAFRASTDKARAIVAQSSADYVLVCQAAPETRFYARHADGPAAEETLSALLGRGEHPDWLQPVDVGPSALSLYRVVR